MKTVRKLALTIALSGMLTLGAAGAYAAPIINFDSAPASDDSNLTTPVFGASVIDFNDCEMPSGYVGQGGVVEGSVSGRYAAPAGNSTCYLSVALNSATGSHTVTPGGSYNYFGLYWGSIDRYNSLEFYFENSLFLTLTGSDVIAAGASFGDQIGPGANRYVNIFLGNNYFDQLKFVTSGYAFESDNHAFARVPEPATLALLGAGLLGFGLRRRKN